MVLFASCTGASLHPYVPHQPPPLTMLHRFNRWLPIFLFLSIAGGILATLIWHLPPTSFWGRVLQDCLVVLGTAFVIRLAVRLLYGL
jgi:hypothetical protein